jgi:hypothetical protein
MPDLTQRARNNLNPADLPVTRLINPIVYMALKKVYLHLVVWKGVGEDTEKSHLAC